MTLEVAIRHRLGDFALDASFASGGRLIALFGPSGSGKTSVINAIAGLTRPDSGRIVVDGRVLVDSDASIFVPMHRRRIGYVFQDARLFPHLTVSQNLRYGRWFTPKAERYGDFGAVVDLLGIGHLLDRRPGALSGGEKQRVAIGRALVASPRLLLMDEPLAALDEARKGEILPYIERLRDEAGIPIVYVSHALGEVWRLASDVVVMERGRVTACGPAGDVLSRPDALPDSERREVGSLIELTVVSPDDGDGLTRLSSPGGDWLLPRIAAIGGERVRVRVRAGDVMLATERPHGVSALNVLRGLVADIAPEGEQALVGIDCGGDRIVARLTRRSVRVLALEPGRQVFAVVKAVTFDRDNRPGSAVRGQSAG